MNISRRPPHGHVLAQPIIPDAAKKILDAMNIPEANRTWKFGDFARTGELNSLPMGLEISAPPVLFTKIEAEDIEGWTERFGGSAESQTA